MKDLEIEAMTAINASLSAIEDVEIRLRVLRWANDKFNFVPPTRRDSGLVSKESTKVSAAVEANVKEGEIPGIASLGEDGEFRVTIRDLKAKSAIDAAVRLAHVVVRAYQKLSGEKMVSSKKILLPALNSYRVYDGNTRAALAREKGLIRKGDELSLDYHAQNDADKYMAEILDEDISGKWTPKNKVAKRAKGEVKSKIV